MSYCRIEGKEVEGAWQVAVEWHGVSLPRAIVLLAEALVTFQQTSGRPMENLLQALGYAIGLAEQRRKLLSQADGVQ